MTDPFPARLEAAKAESTGQLLFQCARLWNEAALARLRAQTGVDVRVAHTQLFPHIPLEGASAVAIAAKAGISKQAVGKLIDDLVGLGLVERAPDPRDGRAHLVRWTARGREGLLAGGGLLKQMEAELTEKVGADAMAALGPTLLRLRGALLGLSP
jgi:DNA-binding MarR family transcriptional regulator